MRISFLLAALFSISGSQAAIIVAETFSGLAADPLNGTSADTFLPAIASAGGSSSWSAHTGGTSGETPPVEYRGYAADGTLDFPNTTTNVDSSAFLSLGSYINDRKGASDGIFTLTATLTQPVGAGTASACWVSVGFFNDNITTDKAFFDAAGAGTGGVGTAVFRESDATGTNNDYFAGLGSGTPNNNFGRFSGTQTFAIQLDLSPQGGYNGVDNFGTISFFRNGGTTAEYSYTYGTDMHSFTGIGFSGNDSPNLTISGFSLSQVPEPSMALLAGAAGTLLLLRRRIR